MKQLACVLVAAMCLSLFSACAVEAKDAALSGGAPNAGGQAVSLRVVTSYGGNDGNAANYRQAVAQWEAQTGHTVLDRSSVSDELWKANILADFETDNEADVVFFFTGADANALVAAQKVVSLAEIRQTYPDYAGNMDEEKMNPSPVDGQLYAVPVNGYWEGLFCNTAVLSAAGVSVPGPATTWDEFIAMCEAVKAAGFVPIAVSMNEVPHYWFEFCVLNNGALASHETVPGGPEDPLFQSWVAGLEDIKALYNRGFFPENTTSASDNDTMRLLLEGQAAFAIDGSWKVGYFQENAETIDDFTVTYVPAKNDRAPTDMIGGLSMGYYITRKGWQDETRRDAIVDFVSHMTGDDVVSLFAQGTTTALRAGAIALPEANSLSLGVAAMLEGATGTVSAVQDNLSGDAKQVLFENMKRVVTGEMTAAQSLQQALALQ